MVDMLIGLDGGLVASGGASGKLSVWDSRKGRCEEGGGDGSQV